MNKSNWANTLDASPFEAYAATCGITFTFGGLRIATDAQVVSTDGVPIPGFYAAGELVGGIFYFTYRRDRPHQRGGIRPHRWRSSGIGDSQVEAWPNGETVVETPLPAPPLV